MTAKQAEAFIYVGQVFHLVGQVDTPELQSYLDSDAAFIYRQECQLVIELSKLLKGEK